MTIRALFPLPVCLVLLSLAAMAQPPVKIDETAPRDDILQAADGFPIRITYYPFKSAEQNAGVAAGANAPVVIILHGEAGNRFEWNNNSNPRTPDKKKPFPQMLQDRGYAVITVDLRKHGESKGNGAATVRAADYPAMVDDLVGVKRFIYDQHQLRKLNMNKTGIIAIGFSCAVAATYAEADWRIAPYDDAPVAVNRTPRGQDVRALVYLSPDADAGRLRGGASLNYLRQPAIDMRLLVVVGADDPEDKKQASELFDRFKSVDKEGKRSYLLSLPYKDRGFTLIQKPEIYDAVAKFLDENLKTIDSDWIDRRSRLER